MGIFGKGKILRKRKKMALYEVIGKSGSRSGYDKVPVQPQQYDDYRPEATDFVATPLGRAARWPRRPRMLFFNAGRVEISLSYPLAVAIVLGLVLLVLVAFWLGQNLSSKVTTALAAVPKVAQRPAERSAVGVPAKAEAVKEVAAAVQKPAAADAGGGNNRIVIQTWRIRAQLEPVKAYFDKCGIETEIITEGGWYYLVTKGKYDNPDKAGTNGYAMKQKIIELGAKYEPPPGSASFGSQPFHDAYGKRFDE